MIPKVKTFRSVTLIAVLLLVSSGIAYGLTEITRQVAATVNVQVKAEDGIEIYLDENLNNVAQSISFGTVEVDVFGTLSQPVAVPVWVENRSNSPVELSLDDDFAQADVVFIPTNANPVLQAGEVLPGELTLEFAQGAQGSYDFTVFFRATGPAEVPTPTPTPAIPTPTPTPSVPPVIQGQIFLAIPNDPSTLDAFMSCGVPSLCDSMSDPLTWFDGATRTLAPLSGIEAWEQTAPDRWVFSLRQGVAFHNGEVFDAQAAAWNIDYQGDAANGTRSFAVTGPLFAEVIDAYTVAVTCESACPILPRTTTSLHFQAPQFYQNATPEERQSQTVGIGPYQFKSRQPGALVDLEAYLEYLPSGAPEGRMPSIKDTRYFIIPEQTVRIAALLVGEVDLSYDTGTGILGRGVDYQVGGRSAVFGALFDTLWNEPLKNSNVRLALNQAVDCEAIVQVFFAGLSACRGNLGQPDTLGITPDNGAPYPYNPDLARQLLAEAGYPDGFSLNLVTRQGAVAGDVEVGEAIVSWWLEMGIDASLLVVDNAVWRQYLDTGCGQYGEDALDCGNRPAPPPLNESPQVLLGAFGDPTLDYGWNASRYLDCFSVRSKVCDPVNIQPLVETARNAAGETRRDTLKQLADIAHDQALFLPLFDVVTIHGVGNRVEWTARFDDRLRTNTISLTE